MSELDQAIRAFDAIHADDPRRVREGEREVPFSVAYHAALVRWVERLEPAPSPALVLACHCQHLGRYAVPRASYPEGGAGYKRWRTTLALKHAEDAARVLGAAGFDEATVTRVSELVTKKRLKSDPEVALFEDAICLTFLELELEAFAAKTEPEKVVEIVRKTWAKMTPRGHAAAMELASRLAPGAAALVARAIAPP